MLVGRLTLKDEKRGTEVGNFWMMNVKPEFSKKSSKWRTASAMVTNSDDGYFVIAVKPDTYTLRSFDFSPGFARPMTSWMSVCCFDRYNQIEIGAGEVVYIGDIHLRIKAKPKKQQLKEALGTGPLAPVLVIAALTNDDEYLEIEITDNFEDSARHFEEKGNIKRDILLKRLLV